MNMTEMELREALQRNSAIRVQGQAHINRQVEKYSNQPEKKTPAKYNNKKTELAGIKFHSKKEANRYGELALANREGYIRDLKLQETFVLQRAFTTASGERIRAITYTADFTYSELEPECGDIDKVIEDCKGKRTKEFDRSWKMMKEKYPEFVYRIT